MAITRTKNDYIQTFLSNLKKETKDQLIDEYTNACMPRLDNGRTTVEMSNIDNAIQDINLFNSRVISPLCFKAREIVINFERDKIKSIVDPDKSAFNRDFWEMRIEEMFFLKLLCIESAKKKNDALLYSFIVLMSSNLKYPFFLNLDARYYNELPDKIVQIFKDTQNGKITYQVEAKTE